MPLHTQAGDTTAVATSLLSLISSRIPRAPRPEATEPHHLRLDGRSPDTGVRRQVELAKGYSAPGTERRVHGSAQVAVTAGATPVPE